MAKKANLKLPIDQTNVADGRTYRDLVKDLDEADLEGNEFAISFVADAIDNPERFRTQKQLDKIEELWERYCGDC